MSLTVTVSQLNTYVASIFRENDKFRMIFVRGEISNFVNHAKSGHFYFTLKEGNCAVKAVMFSRYASQLRFRPENGMGVIVSSSVEVFERDGVYQLYVTDILPDGAGAMYLAAEQLKKRLEEEGVFSEKYKKPIPKYPRRIGVVTAEGGAALRDIIQITGRRYPAAEIKVFPCLVQGNEAPASIHRALEKADAGGCDVIICGRGGGSAEDLAAFNTEEVALAIFDCNTPVISAVGHETDTTIADYAADLRAPTPSAAAELAVPLMSDIVSTVERLESSLRSSFKNFLSALEYRLDESSEKLEILSPINRVRNAGERVSLNEKRLHTAFCGYIESCENRLAADAAQLDALSPLKVMLRGYSIVFKNERAVSSASELTEGDIIKIRFSDGEISAEVK